MSHQTGVETAHSEEREDTLYPNNHARMLCGFADKVRASA